ncbi:MAG: nucleotide sugar dehydrogenase [Magnetococcales bacterium]|nr:nucleotide sugar dehydrogenase [Magnetococcales bacterium]
MKDTLIKKIRSRQAVIGICGLGYVGLPLAIRFLEEQFSVIGFDIDQSKITQLKAGTSYIEHIPFDMLAESMASGRFDATTDFSRCNTLDAVILCLPTPLNRHRDPNLSFVVNSIETILPHLKAGTLISLESTTYPGTTEEEITPRVQDAGWRVGEDMFVVFSPEREDPVNPHHTTKTIPKICGGSTPACLEVGQALYESVIDMVVPVSSTAVAEMVKILENTYRAVNIALVNELKTVADCMGMDMFEVVKAASTKPFGFTPFYPGPGLGGHCIPIDPFYLTWKAREFGLNTRFIELAGEVNTAMPDYVIGKVALSLNKHKKPLNGAKVLILGMAYKKNVDDSRESPSYVLMDKLLKQGAIVEYSDPHMATLPPRRDWDFSADSVELTPETVQQYDCVLISTNHDRFDWDLIREHAQLIVDTRGVYPVDGERIVRA